MNNLNTTFFKLCPNFTLNFVLKILEKCCDLMEGERVFQKYLKKKKKNENCLVPLNFRKI